MDEEFTLPEMLPTLLDTQVDQGQGQGLATCTLHGSWWASIALAMAV